jgi:hypothetical protein
MATLSWTRTLREARRSRGNARTAGSAAAAVIEVGWLPLAAIALVEQLARGHVEPLLVNIAVHVRALVGAPAAALAAWLLDRQVRVQLERLADEEFVARGTVAALAQQFARWTLAGGRDVAIVVIAMIVAQLSYWGILPAPLVGANPVAGERGPAALFYALVTFPLFIFLALRFVLHWLGWTAVLLNVSRQPLALEPAHPDHAGGLSFLTRPTSALALFAFGTTAVASAAWADKIAAGRARLGAFANPCATLLCLFFALALLPLVWFAGPFLRARRRGLREWGQLASTYVRRFHERWIAHPPGPELLGTSDIQSLADLANSVRVVYRMRALPFALRDLAQVVVAVLLPIVPLLLTEIPVSKLIGGALRTVVGAR